MKQSTQATCYICGSRMNNSSGDPLCETRDHVMPKALGGPGTAENIELCCLRCNQIKNDNPPTVSVFVATGMARRLEAQGVAASGSSTVKYEKEKNRAILTFVMFFNQKKVSIYITTKDFPYRREYADNTAVLGYKSDVTKALSYFRSLMSDRLAPVKDTHASDPMIKIDKEGSVAVDVATYKDPSAISSQELQLLAVRRLSSEFGCNPQVVGESLWKLSFTKKSYIQVAGSPNGLLLAEQKLVSGPQHCPTIGTIKHTIARINAQTFADGARQSGQKASCRFCSSSVPGATAGDGHIICNHCMSSLQRYFDIQKQLAVLVAGQGGTLNEL